MAKTIDLRRHFKNDGDVLTADGVAAAVRAGKAMTGRYQLAVSSGAQRATQAVACLLAGHGKPVAGGVVVDPGLRSAREARWMELITEAGGDDLAAVRALDPDFVASEAAALSGALRRVLDALDEGEAAVVVGHSPTNEAAVLGLTGQVVAPLAKGKGVRIVAGEEGFSVTPLG
ncbi:MAG TPA: histidine phosphatase family protein [Acidimicrobiales bacterium]|nr:histidine phosphatase family protein [Acidimicrobiales bacterium]